MTYLFFKVAQTIEMFPNAPIRFSISKIVAAGSVSYMIPFLYGFINVLFIRFFARITSNLIIFEYLKLFIWRKFTSGCNIKNDPNKS